MPGRRVVITGLAVVTSLGSELDRFWENLCDGRSGVNEIESFDRSRMKTKFAGEIRDFSPQPYLDAREQRRTDRFAQFALVGACKAVADAGIEFGREDPFRCGVVLGSGIGGINELVGSVDQANSDPSRISPLLIPRSIINSASGLVSIHFGLRGPNSAVATACASSSQSIGEAFRCIRYEDADVMIAGGSEAAITPLVIAGFNAMRALSQRNDNPSGASRPFDKERDGFVLSEGAGVVVLEEYEHARARGARIYAELLGYGATSDGIHMTAPDPTGSGAARAMETALRDARIAGERVDYINAHGTGTPLGDVAETIAMKKVFGEHARTVAVSSTKSQLGHLLGASGGVEVVISSLAVAKGVMPPTINLHQPDPACDLDYVPNVAREKTVTFAMTNSFGFGGHNVSLVVGKHDEPRTSFRRAA